MIALTFLIALIEEQAQAVAPPPGFSTTAWIIIGSLGSTVLALAGWIKYRERALGKVIGAKDVVIVEKDVKIAGLNDRIDELQEERVQFAQSMLADMQAALDALKGGQGDGSN